MGCHGHKNPDPWDWMQRGLHGVTNLMYNELANGTLIHHDCLSSIDHAIDRLVSLRDSLRAEVEKGEPYEGYGKQE